MLLQSIESRITKQNPRLIASEERIRRTVVLFRPRMSGIEIRPFERPEPALEDVRVRSAVLEVDVTGVREFKSRRGEFGTGNQNQIVGGKRNAVRGREAIERGNRFTQTGFVERTGRDVVANRRANERVRTRVFNIAVDETPEGFRDVVFNAVVAKLFKLTKEFRERVDLVVDNRLFGNRKDRGVGFGRPFEFFGRESDVLNRAGLANLTQTALDRRQVGLDFVELVPTSVVDNQQYAEDWY